MPRGAIRNALALACFAFSASEVFADGGIFVGSTPCDAPVRNFLGIGVKEKCELVRWDLWLALRVNRTTGPNMVASVEYGLAGKPLKKLKREGLWEKGVGTPEHPDAIVYELSRGKAKLALWKVNDETVHLLDAQRKLLVGNSGWSYALSIALAGKPRASEAAPPEMSYSLMPLASGREVYGVFEGRTPCAQAQVIGIKVDDGCMKLKWRITLFQDASTHAATSYRAEGSLFPQGARTGLVTALPGTPFDANARVLRLEPPQGAQPIYLMRGDENVLFFLDQAGRIGLGNQDFNYAISRRQEAK